MVTGSRLLPPNTTPLERALADATPTQLLDTQADAHRRLKSNKPATVVPWLAAEWFLSDFIGYFQDDRALVTAGLPWLRVRGTASAVKQALSWIGMTATLEEDAARLQLDPGTVVNNRQLADISHLVGKSIPSHVLFYRMYNGYDLRPVRLDQTRLDSALLDDDSGVWRDGVKLSFGTRAGVLIHGTEDPIRVGAMRIYSTRVWDDNSWRLDAWALDSEIMVDAVGGIVNQQSLFAPEDIEAQIVVVRLDGVSQTAIPEQDTAMISGRTDEHPVALPSELRTWNGTWAGQWRESIPSRTLFEEA